MTTPGIYEPVKWWQIRLLKLHPGEGDEILQGELHAANVINSESGVVLQKQDQYIEYEALSYYWGPPEFTTNILINSLPTSITPTLAAALKRLRYREADRWIWAFRVVVWLGHAHVNTGVAVDHIRRRDISPWKRIYLDGARTSDNLSICAGIFDLFSRPWILRVWVQQETYAAKTGTIYCGSHEVDLKLYEQYAKEIAIVSRYLDSDVLTESFPWHVRKCAEVLSNKPAATREREFKLELDRQAGEMFDLNCHCATELDIFRSQWSNPECAVYRFGGLHASRPADHIYAILGMTNCRVNTHHGEQDESACSKPQLTIDFSRSASRVYQDFTKYLLHRDGHLRLLVGHIPTSAENNDLGLPSWCPDYRNFQYHGRHGMGTTARRVFNQWRFPIEWQEDSEVGSMQVRGIRVAKAMTRDVVPAKRRSSKAGTIRLSNHSSTLKLSLSGSQQLAGTVAQTTWNVYEKSRTALRLLLAQSPFSGSGSSAFVDNPDAISPGDILVAAGSFDRPSTFTTFGRCNMLILTPLEDGMFLYAGQITLVGCSKSFLDFKALTDASVRKGHLRSSHPLLEEFKIV